MPSPPAARNGPVIALAMVFSAVVLGVLAYLIYVGTVPISPEVRGLAALAVGAAALADVIVGVWFFSKSQSS